MYLYNITLQRATGITHAVHGSFSGTTDQEIVVSRGKILELLRPDPNTGKIHTLLTMEIFGIVRSLLVFKQIAGIKDYLIVTSDSGMLVVFEYMPQKNIFEKVQGEIFGKSGCRRSVPGQYLSVDPKGRAIMIGAVENQKLVCSMGSDAEGRPVITSPFVSHKTNFLVYDCVGLDMPYGRNPIFACLEINYEAINRATTVEAANRVKQSLNFYEFDLDSKVVGIIQSDQLRDHGNIITAAPSGKEGPLGVLICSENYLTYKNIGKDPFVRCPIPRRRNDLDDSERGMLIVCSVAYRRDSVFFFFIQSEQGDLFKVTLDTNGTQVTRIRMKYFDTVPVATSMCILNNGFLFIASEFGNHHLYQIVHLGDDEEPEFSCAVLPEEGDTFFFTPRPLRNLLLIDELDSLSPIVDCHVANLANENTPQLYMVCGRGPRSTLRVLRHSVEVLEVAVTQLMSCPNAVWTVKKRANDIFDVYIVVSFPNSTLVLSTEETVGEVTISGFLGATSTLMCATLSGGAAIQVHPQGFRHIQSDRQFQDWKVPSDKQIVKCAIYGRQVVVALSGGILAYFEMDASGLLVEVSQRKEIGGEVVSMALACVPHGLMLSPFVAVGLADKTVNIISLNNTDCLSIVSTESLPACAESICIVEMNNALHLYLGLQNGLLMRTVLDSLYEFLVDANSRYLGVKPVKLFPMSLQGQPAVIALSCRSWLSTFQHGRVQLIPLSYETLDFASGFASEQCPEGIVAVSSNTLRILSMEKLGSLFNQVSFPLEYTPRKLVIHPDTGNMIIVETEHNAYTEQTKNLRKIQMAKEMEDAIGRDGKEMVNRETGETIGIDRMLLAEEITQDFLSDNLPYNVFGIPKAGVGMWASLIRIISPITGQTLSVTRLEQNEAALSIAVVKFSNQPDSETFVVVGVVKDYLLNLRQISNAYLDTYRLVKNWSELELVHRTLVDDVPSAICAYQGKVLVGVGKLLRLYEMGKKLLLRKCESKNIPNQIVKIECIGRRIYVSDIQESVFFVRYKSAENQLVIFADDTQPRWITTSAILDYNTVATADKFGNIAVVRLGSSVSDDVDEDPAGNKVLWDRGLLNGASQKADFVASFHIGEVVTSLQKAVLSPGGSESLLYTTLSGGVGVLVPFSSQTDQNFFHNLELLMRSDDHNPLLISRDHLSFRSYYYPLKNVSDGDLCEQYAMLDTAKQKSIAAELKCTSNFILKKLEDIRAGYTF